MGVVDVARRRRAQQDLAAAAVLFVLQDDPVFELRHPHGMGRERRLADQARRFAGHDRVADGIESRCRGRARLVVGRRRAVARAAAHPHSTRAHATAWAHGPGAGEVRPPVIQGQRQGGGAYRFDIVALAFHDPNQGTVRRVQLGHVAQQHHGHAIAGFPAADPHVLARLHGLGGPAAPPHQVGGRAAGPPLGHLAVFADHIQEDIDVGIGKVEIRDRSLDLDDVRSEGGVGGVVRIDHAGRQRRSRRQERDRAVLHSSAPQKL